MCLLYCASGKDQTEADLREFKIRHPEITHLRILLHGAVGAGKSSFTNTVNSVFEHRVTTRARAAAGSTLTQTKQINRVIFYSYIGTSKQIILIFYSYEASLVLCI